MSHHLLLVHNLSRVATNSTKTKILCESLAVSMEAVLSKTCRRYLHKTENSRTFSEFRKNLPMPLLFSSPSSF